MNNCIVENCPNTGCVEFTKNSLDKIKSPEKIHINPNNYNFVCSEHFRRFELRDGEENNERDDCQEVLINVVNTEKETVQNEDLHKETEDYTRHACRICGSRETLEKTIDDTINDENIGTMIMLCCHPVIVDPNDGLPNMLCSKCLKTLEISHNFRKKCLEVDKLWSAQSAKKRKQSNDAKPDIKKQCLEVSNTISEPPPLVPIERNKKAIDDSAFVQIEKDMQKIHEEGKIPNNEQLTSYKIYKTANPQPVNLPKGITVHTAKKFWSNLGKYSCVLTHGLQESTFIIADDYLYTFGLIKCDIRHLRCVLTDCKARAEQKLDEERLTVHSPHNHRRPTEQLRKKHMFFHVMRKRMQHDKTLNIRNIYEQVCKQEPEIRQLVPLRNVVNEICRVQVSNKLPRISTFEEFYDKIEDECFEKLHFTNTNKQFYQERFRTEDGSMAIVFCNTEAIKNISDSTLMYVDSSFRIDTFEDFKYQLVTVLVWTDESYYPILYALVNKKNQEIFMKIFQHLHDVLAPELRPHEIVTDYEVNLYYALGETYLESHIGGSVFYYTQNLYKKICTLNLSRELETNSNFRNLYHMLLMLPLLPVNTILDALNNIEVQATELQLMKLSKPIFDHIRSQWILNVTAEMFCVHRLENRINENVIAPFKKFRDHLLLFKGKIFQTQITIGQVVEKLIELESFLSEVYSKPDKKSFGRDLSSFQKKNVLRAWQYIETHPKININNFFQKVLGYIKCMENQLWIWGFYRYVGGTDDVLISGSSSSMYVAENQVEEEDLEDVMETVDDPTEIVETVKDVEKDGDVEEAEEVTRFLETEGQSEEVGENPTIVMEAVIDNDGGVVLQSNEMLNSTKFEKAFFKFVRYE